MNMSHISEPRQAEFVDYYIQAKELGQKLGIEIRTSAANHRRLVASSVVLCPFLPLLLQQRV